MKPKPNSAMNLIKRATQLLTVILVLSIMSVVGYAQEWTCPCFSEEEFLAMSDGVRDVEPYDQITLWWNANDFSGPWGLAYGGEGDITGDGAWTWVEKSEAQGNWCFYQLAQDGNTMVERTIIDITEDQFMACYSAIEAECPAQ